MCVGEPLPWVRIYNCNMIAYPPLGCFETMEGNVILRFWCQRYTTGFKQTTVVPRGNGFAVCEFSNRKVKFLVK